VHAASCTPGRHHSASCSTNSSSNSSSNRHKEFNHADNAALAMAPDEGVPFRPSPFLSPAQRASAAMPPPPPRHPHQPNCLPLGSACLPTDMGCSSRNLIESACASTTSPQL
jgi:hypothetical protein